MSATQRQSDSLIHAVKMVLSGQEYSPGAQFQHLRGIIGVSGGIDSMVLMHVLHRLELPLIVAHVNYHLRGPSSDADEFLVREFARNLGYPIFVHHADPSGLKIGNLQDNARNERRTFWTEVARNSGYELIFLGHHRDDHLETILQRLLRGSGPSSLHAMVTWSPPMRPDMSPPMRPDMSQGTKDAKNPDTKTPPADNQQAIQYVRPLLGISKTDIEAYALQNGVPFRTDETNTQSDYSRNWLRNEITPELDERFPGWRENLQQISVRSQVTAELIESRLHDYHASENILPLKTLQGLSAEAGISVLYGWIMRMFPGGVSEGMLLEIFNLTLAQTGARVPLTRYHYTIWRESDSLELRSDAASQTEESHPPIQLQRTDFSASLMQSVSVPFGSLELQLSADVIPSAENLKVDAETLRWPITLRVWQTGDRMQPLGLKGTSLVSDLLTNKKIRASQKKQAIVVVSFDGRICAVIFPHPTHKGQTGIIAEDARLKSASVSSLNLTPFYPS
jgi:tRNA(Ile)-lysidine synthase